MRFQDLEFHSKWIKYLQILSDFDKNLKYNIYVIKQDLEFQKPSKANQLNHFQVWFIVDPKFFDEFKEHLWRNLGETEICHQFHRHKDVVTSEDFHEEFNKMMQKKMKDKSITPIVKVK